MIDFSKQNLDGMDFGGIDLSGAIFDYSSLKRTQFIGGTYKDSDFEGLQRDGLEDAKLLFSDFSGAVFRDYYGSQSVSFGDVDLSGVTFRDFEAPLSLEGCNSTSLYFFGGSGEINVARGSLTYLSIQDGEHDDSLFEDTSVNLNLVQSSMKRTTIRNSTYKIEAKIEELEGLELDQSKGTLNRVDLTELKNLTVKGGDHNLIVDELNGFSFGGSCWIKFNKRTRTFDSGKMGLGKYIFFNNVLHFKGVICEDADLLGKGDQILNFKNSTIVDSSLVRFSVADGLFYKCDFKNVDFYKCDLGGSSFIECKFNNVDFTTSATSNITMTRCQKSGVKGL